MAEEVKSKAGGEYMEGSGEFKETGKWDAIKSHFDDSDGETEDPTITGKTVNQLVRAGVLNEMSYKLPSTDGVGLTNMEYHKAAGGGDIPMTYGS